MVELAEELFLIHDRVYAAFRNDSCFCHFFHGVELLLLRLLNFPDFTETAPTDDVLESEMVLVHL